MVTFLGITWHVYGLLLGAAVWLAYELMALQARRQQISLAIIQSAAPWVIAGGVVGARLYHVLTDWHLYANQPWEALYIWQGGLSVIGAVLGGALVLVFILRRAGQLKQLPRLLDISVFGLPFAQALGRLGNYANFELYGRPTNLPWAIDIPPAYRLAGYENRSHYHPLFAYEALAMVAFGVTIWGLTAQKYIKPGRGQLFAAYVCYYAVIRFSLDFLRLDAAALGTTGLTVNQAVMVLLLITASYWLWRSHVKTQTA